MTWGHSLPKVPSWITVPTFEAFQTPYSLWSRPDKSCHVGTQSASLVLLLNLRFYPSVGPASPKITTPTTTLAWSVQTIPVPHTSSIPLKLLGPTCAALSGCYLSKADQIAAEWCLQTCMCSKTLSVFLKSAAFTDRNVIEMTIKWQKPLRFHVLFILFSLRALML